MFDLTIMPPRGLSFVLKCDLCSFVTKNNYIYKRHRIRCRRQYGLELSEKMEFSEPKLVMVEGNEQLVADESIDSEELEPPHLEPEEKEPTSGEKVDDGTSTGTEEWEDCSEMDTTVEEQKESEQNGTISSEMQQLLADSKQYSPTNVAATKPDKIVKLPPPPVSRNYTCPDCNIKTTKSRDYLQHFIDVHGEKFSIYPCSFCEYCSKHKQKCIRHMKMAHKKTTKECHSIYPVSPVKQKSATHVKTKPKLTIKMKFKPVTENGKSSYVVVNNKSENQNPSKKVNSKKTILNVPNLSKALKYVVELHPPDGETLYKCKACLYSTQNKQQLYKHVHALHLTAQTFKCTKCDYKTTKKVDWYTHIKDHTSQSGFQCSECNYVTEYKPNYDRHRQNHTNNEKFKCSLCSYSSYNEAPIKRHLINHHHNSAANVSTVVESMDNKYMDTEDSVVDQDGNDDSYVDESDSVQTDDSIHESEEQDVEKSEPNRFRCPVCYLAYKRSSDLSRHMKMKHNLRKKDLESANFVKSGKEEEDSQGYESGDNPLDLSLSGFRLKCTRCSYIAKWPSDLRRHMVVHTVEKKYKCPYCAKNYKYIGDLNVHVRKDHNKEPDSSRFKKVPSVSVRKMSPSLYKCPGCPFTSLWKSELDRHTRLHTDDKPYECRQCDYRSFWKCDVRRHIYRRHNDLMAKGMPYEDIVHVDKSKLGKRSMDKVKTALDLPEANTSLDNGSEIESVVSHVETSSLESSAMDTSMEAEASVSSNSPIARVDENEQAGTSPTSSTVSDTSPKKNKAGHYVCPICNYTTIQSSKIKCHINTHSDLKIYKCSACGKRSNWKWDLQKHVRVFHPDPTAECITLTEEEARSTIREYKEHFQALQKSPRVPENNNTPEPNTVEEVKIKNFKCSLCAYKSAHRWVVSRHLRMSHIETGGDIIAVTEDGAESVSEGQKNKREVSHLPSSNSPSPKFKTPLRSPRKLIIKDAMKKPFMCYDCGKRCSTAGDIRKHYHYIHPDLEIKVVNLQNGTNDISSGTPSPKQSVTKKTEVVIEPNKIGLPPEVPQSSNNPKKTGYIKPFKCSTCGKRSNWKWDCKKHIRLIHNGRGKVILLSEEEARATFSKECPPIIRKREKSLQKSLSPNQPYQQSDKVISTSVNNTNSDPPLSSPPGGISAINGGKIRRMKCSLCPYRSNWRADLTRHFKNKHNGVKGRVLILDAKYASQTVEEYEKKHKKFMGPKPGEDMQVTEGVISEESVRKPSAESNKMEKTPEKQSVDHTFRVPKTPVHGRAWKCTICKFANRDKKLVIRHLRNTHNQQPFTCKLCNQESDHRSAMYRHLRICHGKDLDYHVHVKTWHEFISRKAAQQAYELNNQSAESLDQSDSSPEINDRTVAAENKPFQLKLEILPQEFTELFVCELCHFHSFWRSCVQRHLREKHGTPDYSKCVKVIKDGTEIKAERTVISPEKLPNMAFKKFKCKICPYRASKKKLLALHMSYHKAHGPNKLKCKYCPYYVTVTRLLNQHMQVHTEEEEMLQQSATVNGNNMQNDNRKFQCEKCPYSTNSKNDFLYHKQFHRPNQNALFRCEYCDYCVNYKRLLKQHERLHKKFKQQPHQSRPQSIQSSPCKSDLSDASIIFDTVELASIKQKLIASKITSSLSQNTGLSPMKIATQCSVGNRPGFVFKNGQYRRLLKCRFCPYTNVRSRNLKLHEVMHGRRKADHPLMKCPHCDYYVGSKGLLSHHMKVHQQQYNSEPTEDTTFEMEKMEGVLVADERVPTPDPVELPPEQKVDALLEIARFKKYCCEKCPYASSKRSHFERHVELHGSRQRFSCDFCDYSVAFKNLLTQHQKMHMTPNQNLLLAQSISNLQQLPNVPADIALATTIPPIDSKEPVTISITHDHLDLYENSPCLSDPEPKKLYRCDRCPYANVRRDHLLTHLKFHMIRSELACPYCDYSVAKQHLLVQHIRVHFCPLPELSEWLNQNGQLDRVPQIKDPDLSAVLTLAQQMQNGDGVNGDKNSQAEDQNKQNAEDRVSEETRLAEYVCQYCDRPFTASDQLVRHEMQHLIGNYFEFQRLSSVLIQKNVETEDTPARNGDIDHESEDQDPCDAPVSKRAKIDDDNSEFSESLSIKQEPPDEDGYGKPCVAIDSDVSSVPIPEKVNDEQQNECAGVTETNSDAQMDCDEISELTCDAATSNDTDAASSQKSVNCDGEDVIPDKQVDSPDSKDVANPEKSHNIDDDVGTGEENLLKQQDSCITLDSVETAVDTEMDVDVDEQHSSPDNPENISSAIHSSDGLQVGNQTDVVLPTADESFEDSLMHSEVDEEISFKSVSADN